MTESRKRLKAITQDILNIMFKFAIRICRRRHIPGTGNFSNVSSKFNLAAQLQQHGDVRVLIIVSIKCEIQLFRSNKSFVMIIRNRSKAGEGESLSLLSVRVTQRACKCGANCVVEGSDDVFGAIFEN